LAEKVWSRSKLGGFRADPVEQVQLLDDVADVHVQGLGEPFWSDATLDGAADHQVFLDAGKSIDPVVVGVALVIRGHEAWDLFEAQLLQRDQTCVAIEQDVLARSVGFAHRQGFDQADGLDGRGDLLELARCHQPFGVLRDGRTADSGRRSGSGMKPSGGLVTLRSHAPRRDPPGTAAGCPGLRHAAGW
jgi:hypothetical protein